MLHFLIVCKKLPREMRGYFLGARLLSASQLKCLRLFHLEVEGVPSVGQFAFVGVSV